MRPGALPETKCGLLMLRMLVLGGGAGLAHLDLESSLSLITDPNPSTNTSTTSVERLVLRPSGGALGIASRLRARVLPRANESSGRPSLLLPMMGAELQRDGAMGAPMRCATPASSRLAAEEARPSRRSILESGEPKVEASFATGASAAAPGVPPRLGDLLVGGASVLFVNNILLLTIFWKQIHLYACSQRAVQYKSTCYSFTAYKVSMCQSKAGTNN